MQRALIFMAGLLVGANLVYLVMNRQADRRQAGPPAAPAAVEIAPRAGTDHAGRPDLRQSETPDARAAPSAGPPVAGSGEFRTGPIGTTSPRPGELVVPVQGVQPERLVDTFTDARGADRVHDAIDIMAPRGTPVVAVADGTIEKLFDSERGGLTIYQFEPSARYAYYYAHLDRYAAGLVEGRRVRQGEVIGYVGSTGNASPEGPHLHFAVFVLGPERNWWQGVPINPFPLLTTPQR